MAINILTRRSWVHYVAPKTLYASNGNGRQRYVQKTSGYVTNHPERFADIFLQKLVIACSWNYLESGISSVVVANKMFCPQVSKSVIEGSHYVQGKQEMTLIAV